MTQIMTLCAQLCEDSHQTLSRVLQRSHATRAPCTHNYGAPLARGETRDELRQVKDQATHTELRQCHTVSPLRVCQCTTCQDTPRYTLRLDCPTLTCTHVRARAAHSDKSCTRTKAACPSETRFDTAFPVQVATDDETDLHLRPSPHTPTHHSHNGPTAE